MIRRWNDRVSDDDVVYHLGDFTLGGTNMAQKFFEKLKGRIYVLKGSHDQSWYGKRVLFSLSGQVVEFLGTTKEISYNDKKIQLNHYAQRVWWLSHYGSYHLYGHSHGRLPSVGRSMDVGVDCHNFYPVKLEDVILKLKNERNMNQLAESD